jgi:hypothetical protein
MNQIISGIGDAVGGLLFGQGWNAQDPKEAFRLFAPPNLLDVFSPEEQDAYGEMIRRQMRQPGSHNRPSWAQIQTSISEAAKTKLQQQASEQERAALGGVFDLTEAAPQGGSSPVAADVQVNPVRMPGMDAAAPQMPQLEAPMGAAQPAQPQRQMVNEKQKIQMLLEAARRLAPINPTKAKTYVEMAEKLGAGLETFSAPVAGVDTQTGNPVLVQPGNRGGRRTMEGVAPPPDLTNDIKNYREAVQQGFGGTLMEFIEQVAQAKRPVTTINNNVDLGKGQEKVDTEFAQEYTSFVVRGGYADTVKQLDQLNEALGILSGGKAMTGPIVGNLPEWAIAMVSQDTVKAKEAVAEVVQRSLREILGAQFTEKEGERLIARAFNDRLRPEENAKRVQRLITQIRTMAEAKMSAARHYEQFGTLKDWKGQYPRLSDLSVDAPGGTIQDAAAEELRRRRQGAR